jgi:hypothetical protein
VFYNAKEVFSGAHGRGVDQTGEVIGPFPSLWKGGLLPEDEQLGCSLACQGLTRLYGRDDQHVEGPSSVKGTLFQCTLY